ncbi:lipid-A-disaccharide synthase, partial [Candidatus Saccharibacteria bacterium]|nr:lipid-A-disaccharide synthase [Candidatus Saccharibacteria bacterium]NIV03085.1 lipid-A-disaccharide synthase [Calditrichia bacterium]NIV72736.1 lipid-A-disaccharide synthase [Calditrichia bacterium]NIV98096.1 lipid-A-disaccharide synthase [Candidatus Saccharibacteria bacterium]
MYLHLLTTLHDMQKKMMIIAGETSGDRHAADLVYELNELDPGIEWVGIGGEALRQSGTRLLFHLSQLAFLGITEVIGHLPFIRKVFKAVKNELRNGVDAIILVDYPGFNLRIARIANRINIPVIYYISPQLWAWGEKRVEKMRRYVDLLLVVFQFEETYYNKFGITAHFVGHPLIDQIKINHNEDQFRRHNQIPLEKPILGLFPGSREMEVRKLLPTMVRAAQVLKHKYDCIPAIGCSSHLPRSLYERIVPQADIQLIESQTHA